MISRPAAVRFSNSVFSYTGRGEEIVVLIGVLYVEHTTLNLAERNVGWKLTRVSGLSLREGRD